jgi:hypothetical protein
LNGTALDWPGYLRATAAIALLVEKGTKVTPGQQLEILLPHFIRSESPKNKKSLLVVWGMIN